MSVQYFASRESKLTKAIRRVVTRAAIVCPARDAGTCTIRQQMIAAMFTIAIAKRVRLCCPLLCCASMFIYAPKVVFGYSKPQLSKFRTENFKLDAVINA